MPEILSKLKVKRTSIAGETPSPSFLETGELALNFADGKLFYKNHLGAVETLTTAGGDLTAHKETHSWGGDDELVPSDIRAIASITDNAGTGAFAIGNIVGITQTDYNNLAFPDQNVTYLILP